MATNKDDDRPLSDAEILTAVQGFVARGLAAQKSVDEMTHRCRCGHMLAAHSSHQGSCAVCKCNAYRPRPVRVVR